MVDELHLFGGRVHPVAVDLQLIIGQVDGEAVVRDLLVFRLLHALYAAAAQHGMDPGHHLFGLKGLDHVVVGPQVQAQHPVEHLAFGGKHNNRALGAFADFPHHLPAVQPGEHNIQQHQVGLEGFKGFQGGLAVRGQSHLEVLFFHIEPQELANVGVIVHDEDFTRSHRG